MKIIIYLVLSVVSAFAFDSIVGQIPGGNIPPLMVIIVFYWFWRLDLGQRLLLSMVSGVILDTIGFLPSGVYTLMFVCGAVLCVPMKNFFSNTESRPVTVLSVIILTLVFRLSVVPASSLVQLLGSLV